MLASATLPPAIPCYVLRGHSAQVHCLHFLRDNLRLLSGDADGWVILWDLVTKRAAAVWQAHSNAVLGVGSWGEERIITHGRDSKLIVWQLRPSDEIRFNKILPIEDSSSTRPQPWIEHVLTVHTLNFCSFAICNHVDDASSTLPASAAADVSSTSTHADANRVLVATPGLQDGCIVITALPDDSRYALIPTPNNTHTGMLMAVALVNKRHTSTGSDLDKSRLYVLAGYESGHVALWTGVSSTSTSDSIFRSSPVPASTTTWQAVYLAKPHSQPVLSIAASHDAWYSSSADAILACHPLESPWNASSMQAAQTRHAGQQGLCVRSDGQILAAAGWDARVRVYQTQTLNELAVLKWHKEGCYAAAFANVMTDTRSTQSDSSDLSASKEVVGTNEKRLTVAEQRVAKAKAQHLLAAGSKDGKISLWDIY